MASIGRKQGRGADAIIADCQALLGPERTAIRQAQIDALPRVDWRGPQGTRPARTLYTLRCHGTSGRGAHDTNVPLVLLWSLIEIRRYLCPYHTGDAWSNTWDMAGRDR